MKEIKLSKSVRAHGDELYVLELREPTGKDGFVSSDSHIQQAVTLV